MSNNPQSRRDFLIAMGGAATLTGIGIPVSDWRCREDRAKLDQVDTVIIEATLGR